MGRAPLPDPLDVLLVPVVVPVLRAGKPLAPVLCLPCLLALRGRTIPLTLLLTAIRRKESLATGTLTLPDAPPRCSLHPAMFHGRTITGEIRINAQESGEENPKKEEEFLFESSEEDHRQEENHIFKPDVSTHHHNGHGNHRGE